MERLADAVGDALRASGFEAQARRASSVQLSASDAAALEFLVAIYSAHQGQPLSVYGERVRAAVRASSTVVPFMRAYVDLQLRSAPKWMCTSYATLCESRLLGHYQRLSDPRLGERLADFELLRAVIDALEEAGVSCRQDFTKLIAAERGLQLDLLDSRYWARSDRERRGFGTRRAFFRAHYATTRFYIPSGPVVDGEIEISFRADRPGGELGISLDAQPLVRLPLRNAWVSRRVAVPERTTSHGFAALQLDWPEGAGMRARDRDRAEFDLAHGRLPEPLPTYGDVLTLRWRPSAINASERDA